MIRGPLARDDYRPQFSGHETFPLRYGWLKKAYDAVCSEHGGDDTKAIFSNDDAIARFGVGKNMVASIRHWAIASDIVNGREFKPTPIGDLIFGQGGLDPYMENPCTLWLVHWHLAGRPEKTTWYWAFNHFQGGTFEREHLVKGLEALVAERMWTRASINTVKRDVECFVRLYVAKPSTGKDSHEDALESPLIELGLIRPVGRCESFRFVRGTKPTLGDNVFLYALTEFWNNHTTANTLSFEVIAHEPGSPGRVFLLDEDEIYSRLQELEDTSAGTMRFSETAGLKQVIRKSNIKAEDVIELIRDDYNTHEARSAA